MTYTVTATRSGRWWTLQCAEVPGAISQVRRLEEAPAMAAEAIAFVLDVDEGSIPAEAIDVEVQLPDDLRELLGAARGLRAQAESLERQAQSAWMFAAAAMHDSDYTLRDIGQVLGVSHQRAHQLIQAAETHRDAGQPITVHVEHEPLVVSSRVVVDVDEERERAGAAPERAR